MAAFLYSTCISVCWYTLFSLFKICSQRNTLYKTYGGEEVWNITESSIIKGEEQLFLTPGKKRIVQKAGLSMVIIEGWDETREYCKKWSFQCPYVRKIFLKNVVAMHVYGWNKIPDLLEIFILMWCQLNFNPQDKQTLSLSSFEMSNWK